MIIIDEAGRRFPKEVTQGREGFLEVVLNPLLGYVCFEPQQRITEMFFWLPGDCRANGHPFNVVGQGCEIAIRVHDQKGLENAIVKAVPNQWLVGVNVSLSNGRSVAHRVLCLENGKVVLIVFNI